MTSAIKDRIQSEMKAALLGGDRFVGETLRNLKGAILDVEVAEGKRETGLTDEEIEKIVAREIKKRTESARIYRENNRDDLAEPEEREIEILSNYLPAQMDEEALKKLIEAKIAELGATGPQMMGQVISAVKKEAGNSADGALVARLVKEALQQ
jgi:uncharacterized protein YqeY